MYYREYRHQDKRGIARASKPWSVNAPHPRRAIARQLALCAPLYCSCVYCASLTGSEHGRKLRAALTFIPMAMPIEIERKFLVKTDAWRPLVVARKKLRQGYLAQNDRTSVRVRITDEKSALLTVKSRDTGRRLEFEYPIPRDDAITLLELREGSIISKVRHIVPAGNLKWEIDVFEEDSRGLVLAEIEVPSLDHRLILPDWVGPEVTHDGRYYNSHLVLHPFSSWPHQHSGAALERQCS